MGLRFKIKYYLGIAALQADWNVIPVEISKSSTMLIEYYLYVKFQK